LPPAAHSTQDFLDAILAEEIVAEKKMKENADAWAAPPPLPLLPLPPLARTTAMV
jgi:hypothetical protein